MNRDHPIFLYIIMTLFFIGVVYGEEFPGGKDFILQQITSVSGLSQNSVNDIMQDQQGFIWIATTDGLNRFDGYNFKVFKPGFKWEKTISHGWVKSIAQDNAGLIWIGTARGLDCYDPVLCRFKHHKHDPAESNSISHDNILKLFVDSQGKVWVGTKNGLNCFKTRTNGFVRYYPIGEKIPNDINDIFEDKEKNLWICCNNKVLHFNPGTEIFTSFNSMYGLDYPFHGNSITKIIQDQLGYFWIAETFDGLYRIDPDKKEVKRFTFRKKKQAGRIKDWVSIMFESHLGDLWVGTHFGELHLFDRGSQKFINYKHSKPDQNRLGNNTVKCIHEDRSHLLWVGIYGNGIVKIIPRSKLFTTYTQSGRDSVGLNDKSVLDIFEDKEGILWVGTERGLNQKSASGNGFIHYGADMIIKYSASQLPVRSICEDDIGRLWIGTSLGLNRLIHNKNRFVRFVHNPKDPSSLSHSFIRKIINPRFEPGILWIGTLKGLNQFNPETGKCRRFYHDPTNPNSLSNNHIYTLFEDSQGRLWIGTLGGGLNRFEPNSSRFIRYPVMESHSSGLSNPLVTSICEEKRKSPEDPVILWIGTLMGLNRLNTHSGDFKHYLESDGLCNNTLYGVLCDDEGNLWVSTNNGISKLNLKTKRFTNYRQEDGLQNNEFNGDALLKDRSGRIYFGGINGLSVFHPSMIRDNTYIPPVVITDLLMFNKPVNVASFGLQSDIFQLKQHIGFTKKITLDHTQKIFSFEFSALNYIESDKNQYAFKLEGFSEEWIETDSKNRRATYTNLPHGEYTFRVKASNNDGYWNEEGVSIKLTILPPPWKTWWAYTLYILAFLGFLLWFIQSQLKKVRQKQKELDREKEFSTQLEQKVKERTAELEESYSKLEVANLKLEKLTVTDGLTGIANYRQFEEFYKNEWKRAIRNNQFISIIMIDIDYFKSYNDTYGHQMGDECLKKVAKVLVESIFRVTDLAARYGGEEFVVVLSETDSHGAKVVAERLRFGVESLQLIHEESKVAKHVTISLGCATASPKSGDIPEILINAADKALYQSKQQGRNRITVF